MRFSFTTVPLCVPRRWRPASGTLGQPQNHVFFIRVRFGEIHKEVYRDFGFELVPVEP
jgi:hypothetical protein